MALPRIVDDSPRQRRTTGLAVGEGWQVLKIGGIPLRLQPSWLFAVAIFTTLFQSRYATTASVCLLYTSPSPRDMRRSRMPSSA